MTSPLPQATRDLDRAQHDLDEFGYCLIEDAISQQDLADLRARLVEVAYDEVEAGTAFIDSGGSNQRVWALLNKGQEFRDLATNPVALQVMRRLIGDSAENMVMSGMRTTEADPSLPGFLLGSITANIAGPGNVDALHADQFYVPTPWPPYPLLANVAWMLDDYTAENGGTNVVPGSHKWARFPDVPRHDDQIPVEGNAGTALVFEGRTWHCTGTNQTNQKRHGILSYYCRGWLRTQENHTVSTRPNIVADASPILRRLLGLDTYGSLGMVDGIPGRLPPSLHHKRPTAAAP